MQYIIKDEIFIEELSNELKKVILDLRSFDQQLTKLKSFVSTQELKI